MTRPWPVPTDTVTDRARTIARGLLGELRTAETEIRQLRDALVVHGLYEPEPPPGAADRYVAQASGYGELWLAPTLDTVGEERRLTVAEAAALVGRQQPTIRQWISRGTAHGRLIRHPDGIDERQLLDLDSAMRHGAPPQGAAPTEGTQR